MGIDCVYVINLASRQDRWAQVSSMLIGMNVMFERVEACTPPIRGKSSSRLACRKSHIKVLELQRQRSQQRVLILEDDCILKRMPNDEELSVDFDQLYLGGNHHHGLEGYAQGIRKTLGTYSTHAYLSALPFSCLFLERYARFDSEAIDVTYARIHRKFKCYTVYPGIATQRSGFSDIENKNVDYSGIIK